MRRMYLEFNFNQISFRRFIRIFIPYQFPVIPLLGGSIYLRAALAFILLHES